MWYGDTAESMDWKVFYQVWNGSGWSTPEEVSGRGAGGCDVAVDGTGTVHVVWNAPGNPEDVFYRRRTSGVWGATANLSASANRSLTPRIAVDGSGNSILVVWHESAQTGGNWDILARKYTAGNWGTVENVSQDSTLSRTADVVVDASGSFHIAWEDLDTKNLVYRKRNLDGTYGGKTPLDNSSGRSFGAALAIGPNGHIHAAWHDDVDEWEILYRYFNGSSWSSIVNISNHPDPDHADNTPAIDVDASNQVHVAWHDYQNVYYSHTVNSVWRPKYVIGPGAVSRVPALSMGAGNRVHVIYPNRDAGTWDAYHTYQNLPDTMAPAPVTNFRSYGSSGQVRLDWSTPNTFDYIGVMIRYKTTGYPTGPTDGTLVGTVSDPGYFIYHTGLQNNVTYYYSAFAYDAEPNYAPAATTFAVPISPPKTNLLSNGGMESTSGGVANNWTTYKVNDPNNAISFAADSGHFDSANLSQAILGIDGAGLPASGLTAAGLRQVVTNLTAGRVYLYVGYQDLYTSDFGADSRRYLHNFGVNVLGETAPGALNTAGTIGNAKWTTASQAFWNNHVASSSFFGGFHRARAAFVAATNKVSIWTGLTIDNAAARDNATVKFNVDTHYLFEFDFPTNEFLLNPSFEGQIVDLQNGGDSIPDDWLPCGGGVGQVNSTQTTTNFARVQNNVDKGVRIWSRRGVVNAGLMQRVRATNGHTYTFTAWARCSGQDGAQAAIGIDPLGGGDILNASIVWSTPNTTTTWTQLSNAVVAQASSITLFVRTVSQNSAGANYQWSDFDDTQLSAGGVAPQFLINAGAVWKYLDNGSDQGTAWRAVGFNDSAWASGAAELGYGDAAAPENRPEVTLVSYGSSATNKHVTTYFRRNFMLTNAQTLGNVTLRLVRDDGAVVYLNGTEVFRNNMPTGVVNYATLATGTASGADEYLFLSTNIPPTLLVNGTNVVAVEMHQSSRSSTDLSFDLELSGVAVGVVPTLQISLAGSSHVLRWPSSAVGFRLYSTTSLGAESDWTIVSAAVENDGTWQRVTIPGGGGTMFYRLAN